MSFLLNFYLLVLLTAPSWADEEPLFSLGLKPGESKTLQVLQSSQQGTLVLVKKPLFGTATIKDGLTIEYQADLEHEGNDPFLYQYKDGQGQTQEGQILTSLSQTNQAPSSQDDVFNLSAQASLELDVLANDHDPDGDKLDLYFVGRPLLGTAKIKQNKIIYTPPENFQGVDTFYYAVHDHERGLGSAKVTIHFHERKRLPAQQAPQK